MPDQVSRHYLMRCPDLDQPESGVLFSIKLEGTREEIIKYPDVLEEVECWRCDGKHDANAVTEEEYVRQTGFDEDEWAAERSGDGTYR